MSMRSKASILILMNKQLSISREKMHEFNYSSKNNNWIKKSSCMSKKIHSHNFQVIIFNKSINKYNNNKGECKIPLLGLLVNSEGI